MIRELHHYFYYKLTTNLLQIYYNLTTKIRQPYYTHVSRGGFENFNFTDNFQKIDNNVPCDRRSDKKEFPKMAAVICNGIGSCCEFVCQIPCKVCSACSKGCGSGCSRLCASPLSAYVATVLVTQIPMIVFSLMEIGGIFRGCHGSYWLLGALLVAIVHVVVAFYASYRVTNGTDEKLREAGRHTAYERISFLLCRCVSISDERNGIEHNGL